MEIDTLIQLLWPKGNGPDCPQVYALLDGARDEAITPAIWLSNLPFACLYAGKLSRSLERAAPYLVQLAPESRFFNTLVSEGWGQAWGIFAVAQPDVTLKVLRRHLRTLLQVHDEAGHILVFRFYDPRVLRNYLPTCTAEEVRFFLGPMHQVACERGDEGGMSFFNRDDLRSERIAPPSSRMPQKPPRSPLLVRSAQMRAQQLALNQGFAQALMPFIRSRYESATAAFPTQDALTAWIAVTIDSAQSFGLRTDRAIAAFIELVLQSNQDGKDNQDIARLIRHEEASLKAH